MCTHPITVSRTRKDGSTLTETFPCGKCAECRAKDQSSFAALSCLEAESAGSIGFLTLTYDNAHVPVLITRHYRGEVVSSEFDDTADCYLDPVEPMAYEDEFEDCVEVYGCASLRRDDVKLFVKAYREDYYRRNGKRLDLRLTYFGEYGERKHRPHYHMLVYGLDRSELVRMSSFWKLGFVDVRYISHFNSDGSDAFVKVSRYVSKYVGKRDYLPSFVLDGYAEKPRKVSSIRLGRRNLDFAQLKDFILPPMSHDLAEAVLISLMQFSGVKIDSLYLANNSQCLV